jgi:hypothetical protein
MVRNPKHGHRVMIMRGHKSQDTEAFVGTIGTIVGIYSDNPATKDQREFCIAVKCDNRLGRDLPMLFRAKDLTSSNPKGK